MAIINVDYEPRDYQIPFLRAMANGCKNACLVWHRRSGKDLTAWNFMIAAAFERVGNFFYYFPTGELGRRVVWNGKTRDGKTFLDFIPKGTIARKHETAMRIELINGSMIQIVGTDDVDRAAVGTSAHGAIFSEYSIQNPDAALYISPILKETGGWTVYVYTPRGHNHGYDLYSNTLPLDSWFTEKLGIDKTLTMKDSDLDEERVIGKSESFLQQDYYCSFEASLEGAYFGDQMIKARADGRICNVPYDERLPVSTFWDLGVHDATTIWFVQKTRTEYRFIGYYENNDVGLPHYAQLISKMDYQWGAHVAPHDIQVREFGSGMARIDTALDLGINFYPGYKYSKLDQIDAARGIFGQCYFDETACEKGLHALAAYKDDFDAKLKVRTVGKTKNWAGHAADSFMLFATNHDLISNNSYNSAGPQHDAQLSFDPYTGRPYGVR